MTKLNGPCALLALLLVRGWGPVEDTAFPFQSAKPVDAVGRWGSGWNVPPVDGGVPVEGTPHWAG